MTSNNTSLVKAKDPDRDRIAQQTEEFLSNKKNKVEEVDTKVMKRDFNPKKFTINRNQ